MKYFVFFTIALVGIPGMTFAAISSAKLRGWLLTLLIVSTALGDLANINFLSLEDYRGPDRGFEINLTDLVAFALAFALIIKFPKKVQWFPAISVWLLLMFFVSVASTWTAAEPLLGSFSLLKLFKSYVVFWCVVNALRVGVDKKYVWWGLAAIGLLFTGLALKQKYLDGIYRIHGTFDHSNTVPLYLNLIMPVLLIWGLTDKTLEKWKVYLSIAAALGMVFAVAATFSRAGTALAGMGVIAMLVTANLRAKSMRVTITSIITALAILGGGLKAADSFLDRIQNAPKSSEEARDEFNVAASMMARDRWFGIGLNNFSSVLTQTPRYREHITVMANEAQAGVAHHIYWLTAAETGFIGLAIFLGFIARVAFLAGWNGLRSRSLDGNLLAGLFMGLLALHLSGFLEWGLRITPVTYLFYISCGLCVALAGEVRNGRKRVRQVTRPATPQSAFGREAKAPVPSF